MSPSVFLVVRFVAPIFDIRDLIIAVREWLGARRSSQEVIMSSSSTSSSLSHFTESTSSVSSGSAAHKADSESIGMSKEASGSKVREDHVDTASWLAAEVTEDNLPYRTRYEWASSHVTRHFSKYRWSSMVESYVTAYRIFTDDIPDGALSIERYSAIDNV